jgi:hypothetical protein
MTLRQAILIPTLGLPLASAVVLGLYGGGWFYLAVLGSATLALGIFEIISIKKRGKTISKDIGETPRWVFWLVTGSFLFLGVGMAIHWILYL